MFEESKAGGPLAAEVVGFRDELTLLYPFGDFTGVRPGDRVRLRHTTRWTPVGPALLGRVVNALGQTIDGGEPLRLNERVLLRRSPPNPVERPRIDTHLSTGVRTIDGLLTCGKGQRIGIIAGSGVGKSVLLGMMSR